MKAIILAAGYGHRMLPLTQHTPKPLLKVAGKPLIEHHLEKLAASGIEDVIINTSHLGDAIQETLGSGSRFNLNIRYSPESEPLGTGGGIRRAMRLLNDDEPFIVLNADIWTDYPLQQLPSQLPELAHLVLVPKPDYYQRGDFGLAQDYVTVDGDELLTFSGLGVYSPQLFHAIDDDIYPLTRPLRIAIAQSLVTGEQYDGKWVDVGTPERLYELNESLDSREPSEYA